MLTRLEIHHVRNLKAASLQDFARINVLSGRNGSGKTSVLESIHLLGMARTFRSGNIKSLISHGSEDCTVYGQVRLSAGPTLTLGVQRYRSGEVNIRIGGRPVRAVAELAQNLPLQVINASSFELLTGTPAARRRYLDWGVFHVEQHFLPEWQRFQRAIKQRNMLLRRGKLTPREIEAWTRDLVASGNEINNFRRLYFEQLYARFQSVVAELIPDLGTVELRYRQGWDRHLSLQEAIQASLDVDRERGFTHIGPQRADVRVIIGGSLAAETLSRGQQKLVVCALKLAQGSLMLELGSRECTYLVDDLPSELDEEHTRLVCEKLSRLGAQVFITCVNAQELGAAWPASVEPRVFHVEQGDICPE